MTSAFTASSTYRRRLLSGVAFVCVLALLCLFVLALSAGVVVPGLRVGLALWSALVVFAGGEMQVLLAFLLVYLVVLLRAYFSRSAYTRMARLRPVLFFGIAVGSSILASLTDAPREFCFRMCRGHFVECLEQLPAEIRQVQRSVCLFELGAWGVDEAGARVFITVPAYIALSGPGAIQGFAYDPGGQSEFLDSGEYRTSELGEGWYSFVSY